ncbi:hypothetical protein A3E17_00775 [Candidatus Amesbacteria bacterium RIFCSPHIGHO2_12_FULL_48_14]|uniref:glycogen phosphorylase n=3 Tax=Candidatus Amesiibacteriota TaxID=1752730 RepID=A0A1F4Z4B8_9BACT|nr:MAG: hypothetical protein A3E17_00775 [Candidatus Amesbacteria bacterium RIFCSPHIGHO2_12_FULL_48_14]
MVAYFCLEYAFDDNPDFYRGGLGVLSGDLLLQAEKDNFPLVALGLYYSHSSEFNLVRDSDHEIVKIPVEVGDHVVAVQAWAKSFGQNQLLLLDSNLPENSPEDRKICQLLYDPDKLTMLKQQLILCIGGVRLLRQLGIPVDVYHLNEGHTAMVLLELGRENQELYRRTVATKHTIFFGAGLHLTPGELSAGLSLFLKKYGMDFAAFFKLGEHSKHPGLFSTTNFLLRHVNRACGVSKSHVFFEKKAHSESRLIPITNGVFTPRWQIPDLPKNPWPVHLRQKKYLLDKVREKTGHELANDKLTIVWSRRLVKYKRPELLFNNLDQLSRIVNDSLRPVQFIIAGLTNYLNPDESDILNILDQAVNRPDLSGKVVFWPDYDITLAKIFTSGADVLLNTPMTGLEACGTSGMKAGLNGVLSFSVSDGWYAEVNLPDFGWVLPEEGINTEIYRLISEQIAPLYYQRDASGTPVEWVVRMEKTIRLVEDNFTSARMLKDYREKLYSY